MQPSTPHLHARALVGQQVMTNGQPPGGGLQATRATKKKNKKKKKRRRKKKKKRQALGDIGWPAAASAGWDP